MSLSKHARHLLRQRGGCPDTVWIAKRVLEATFNQFVHKWGHTRSVSSVPGPLEARRRAAKRRMVNVALVASPPTFDPSPLPGWGSQTWPSGSSDGNPEENAIRMRQGSDYTKRLMQDNDQNCTGGWHLPLPEWLLGRPEVFAENCSENQGKLRVPCKSDAGDSDPESFVEQISACEDIESMRNLDLQMKLKARDYSKQIFERLLCLAKPVEVLLGFLEDLDLNHHQAENFRQLLRRGFLRELSPVALEEAICRIASWSRTQLSLGKFSEQEVDDLLLFARDFSNRTYEEGHSWQILKAMIEGLESCPVFGFSDLGELVLTSLLDGIGQLPYDNLSLELGCRVIGQLKEPILQRLIPYISLSCLHMLHSTYQSPRSDDNMPCQNGQSLHCVFATLLQSLPSSQKLSFVGVASRLLIKNAIRLDHIAWSWLCEDWWSLLDRYGLFLPLTHQDSPYGIPSLMSSQSPDNLMLFTRHLDGRQLAQFVLKEWSCVSASGLVRFHRRAAQKEPADLLSATVQEAYRAKTEMFSFVRKLFGLLKAMRRSKDIFEIVTNAWNFRYALPDAVILETIHEHLLTGPYWARLIYLSHSRLLLERIPRLAEAVILGSRGDAEPKNVWTFLRYKGDPSLKAGFGADINRWRKARADLLARIARAFSIRRYKLPSTIAFHLVKRCYDIHVDEQLGFIDSSLSQALVRVGIILPLQRKEPLSAERVAWIKHVIQEVEGRGVADDLKETIMAWRPDVGRHLTDNDSGALSDALAIQMDMA